jgi:catechol 2,3-dioxygenase-like lactoylglutathione lyase family enzyme
MFEGLRTVIYRVGDLETAKTWYTRILGFGPYFDEPFYVGFNVGGYELGLLPASTDGDSCPITYWGVSDVPTALERLFDAGATSNEDPQDVGDGIVTASVRDLDGNVVGVIFNPNFKLEEGH